MDVSGVFSSCETFATNVVFCIARRDSAESIRRTTTPPVAMTIRRIATRSHTANVTKRACDSTRAGSASHAPTSQRGSRGEISRATNGLRQSGASPASGASSGFPFSSSTVRIRTSDRISGIVSAMRRRSSFMSMEHPVTRPSGRRIQKSRSRPVSVIRGSIPLDPSRERSANDRPRETVFERSSPVIPATAVCACIWGDTFR